MPTGSSERMGALATPVRTRPGDGLDSGSTPRQAAMNAKKQMAEEKRRQAMAMKQKLKEEKATAKAKQEAMMAQRQVALKERAQKGQKRREAAAASRKASREKETAAQAKKLQASMQESRELKERLLREEKERRRINFIDKSAKWSRERDFRRKLEHEKKKEQQELIEAHEVFREARNTIRELDDKQERVSMRSKPMKSLQGEHKPVPQRRRADVPCVELTFDEALASDDEVSKEPEATAVAALSMPAPSPWITTRRGRGASEGPARALVFPASPSKGVK